MKRNLSDIGLIAFFNAAIPLLLCYCILLNYNNNGISNQQALIMLLLPGLIFFICILVLNTILVRRMKRIIYEEDVSQTSWRKLFGLLLLLTIVVLVIIDSLAYFVLPEPFKNLGKAFDNILADRSVSEADDASLSSLTFFFQGIFQNFFAISTALLISTFLTRKYASNEKKS